MSGLLRRREMGAGEADESDLLYRLAAPAAFTAGAYQDTGLVLTKGDTFTALLRADVHNVSSTGGDCHVLKLCIWTFRMSNNNWSASANVGYRFVVDGLNTRQTAFWRNTDGRAVLVSTPTKVYIYLLNFSDQAFRTFTYNNTDKAVSETVQFGSQNANITVHELEIWKRAYTAAEAEAWLRKGL